MQNVGVQLHMHLHVHVGGHIGDRFKEILLYIFSTIAQSKTIKLFYPLWPSIFVKNFPHLLNTGHSAVYNRRPTDSRRTIFKQHSLNRKDLIRRTKGTNNIIWRKFKLLALILRTFNATTDGYFSTEQHMTSSVANNWSKSAPVFPTAGVHVPNHIV